jgi:hypothetical protein
MAWNDDSWRDSYDAWKLASPDDYDECLHEDYEADVNGRATCDQCGTVWCLTKDEIERERQLHVAYDRMMRREEWRQWREDWVHRLAFWRRWRKPALIDDDIPF